MHHSHVRNRNEIRRERFETLVRLFEKDPTPEVEEQLIALVAECKDYKIRVGLALRLSMLLRQYGRENQALRLSQLMSRKDREQTYYRLMASGRREEASRVKAVLSSHPEDLIVEEIANSISRRKARIEEAQNPKNYDRLTWAHSPIDKPAPPPVSIVSKFTPFGRKVLWIKRIVRNTHRYTRFFVRRYQKNYSDFLSRVVKRSSLRLQNMKARALHFLHSQKKRFHAPAS